MKKIIVYIGIFLMGIAGLLAQPPKQDKDKIHEIKQAYFVEQLKLTKTEIDKFLPLYEKYDAERRALRKASKKPGDKKKFSEMTEKEINDFIQYNFTLKEKELQLQKKYFEEFKKVLPAHKVVKLLNIEEQFRQYLLKQVHNKK